VSMRIQLSNATAKALQTHLQDAYHKDEVRLVRRITVLLALLVHHVLVSVVCERWRLSPSCLYAWQKAFLVRGMDSLRYRHGGGRPEKLTPSQKKRLVELIEAGPLVVGLETACWNSVVIRVLIWREFGVLYNRQYVCTLRHNLGFSFQKARFVSDHLDAAKRMAWRWAFARSRSAVALGRHSYRGLRLQAFLQGMLAGLRMPVNTSTGQYKREP